MTVMSLLSELKGADPVTGWIGHLKNIHSLYSLVKERVDEIFSPSILGPDVHPSLGVESCDGAILAKVRLQSPYKDTQTRIIAVDWWCS